MIAIMSVEQILQYGQMGHTKPPVSANITSDNIPLPFH